MKNKEKRIGERDKERERSWKCLLFVSFCSSEFTSCWLSLMLWRTLWFYGVGVSLLFVVACAARGRLSRAVSFYRLWKSKNRDLLKKKRSNDDQWRERSSQRSTDDYGVSLWMLFGISFDLRQYRSLMWDATLFFRNGNEKQVPPPQKKRPDPSPTKSTRAA